MSGRRTKSVRAGLAGGFKQLKEWAGIISLLVILAGFGFKVFTYWQGPVAARRKVQFRLGIALASSTHARKVCEDAHTLGGFSLCKNEIHVANAQLTATRSLLKTEVPAMRVGDFETAELGLQTVHANLVTALENMAYNKVTSVSETRTQDHHKKRP